MHLPTEIEASMFAMPKAKAGSMNSAVVSTKLSLTDRITLFFKSHSINSVTYTPPTIVGNVVGVTTFSMITQSFSILKIALILSHQTL
jgi:hypothetical protein